MRNRTLFFCLVMLFQLKGLAQTQAFISNESDVSRILKVLASDSLKGRGNHKPELLKAASFIAAEFNNYGLQVLPSSYTFWHPFNIQGTVSRDVLYWNNDSLKSHMFLYFTPQLIPAGKKLSDFELVEITTAPSDSLLYQYWNYDRDVLLWYHTPDSNGLPPNMLVPSTSPPHDVLWVAHSQKPDNLLLTVHKSFSSQVLFNIASVLPGKSKPNEYVIFSAHYDHLGDADKKKGDGVFNGANDNASGIAALLSLARYYAARNDNERSLIFCAFAGEELGLLGSKAFVKTLVPDAVKAMVNIEMIGRAQYGKNKVFITGAFYSDFNKLFRENIKGTSVKIIAEPDEEKKLFKRSDNFPFALEGIPAHTIMSSDDDDACYHRECDEIERIDVTHMATVIDAIIKGCAPIISGLQTPSRINKNRLY